MTLLLQKLARATRMLVASADVFVIIKDVKEDSARPSDMFKVTQQVSGSNKGLIALLPSAKG